MYCCMVLVPGTVVAVELRVCMLAMSVAMNSHYVPILHAPIHTTFCRGACHFLRPFGHFATQAITGVNLFKLCNNNILASRF